MSFLRPQDIALPAKASKQPHVTTVHGDELRDDYHWMRAENWQAAVRDPSVLPEPIKAYLDGENRYCEQVMASDSQLQEQLVAEMRGRISEAEAGVPVEDGEYAYNWCYKPGDEHERVVQSQRDGSNELVILDGNAEVKGAAYFALGDHEVSPNHQWLAWSQDRKGSEYYQLHIRDLNSGEDLAYSIADVGAVAWCGNEYLYYTRVDDNHRPSRLYRHRVNHPGDDVLVYTEQDERFYLSVGGSLSTQYLFMHVSTNDQDEWWFLDTANPLGELQLIQQRQTDLEYEVEHRGDEFFILSNANGAEDFQLFSTAVATPQLAHWQSVVPHRQGSMIVDMAVYAEWLVWVVREAAQPTIYYRGQDGVDQRLAFADPVYHVGLIATAEFNSDTIRYGYSSPVQPDQVVDYNLANQQRVVRKTDVVPSGHEPSHYRCLRIQANGHDGVQIPVTILHHRDTPLDGSAPCLLYGYGSYGASIPARFSTNRLSLVDRGFVYAIAHVRGGQELGRAWYEAAKGQHKPNTFKDFIAAGHALIAANYTAKGQIICHGGSAGGLLVGAVVNMAPELFAGAVADVPFVDVLNTILDDTLPLTPGEWSQWGNPIESAEVKEWIKGYSPYDNVVAQDYPAMLVTAGVADPRVTYWEPAKWVAKLRETKTDDRVLLLKTNMNAGHFGDSGRFAALQEVALLYAFMLRAVGKA